ncbi:putative porin [Candidatus Latescibacterota bacterium]
MKALRSIVVSFALALILSGASQVFAQSNMKIGADLRYRHELIDAEGKVQRNRERVRARINMTAELNDEVTLGFQIASGTDSPVSTNQTFDGGFSSKQANIDLAYFQWNPAAVTGAAVTGGKVKNPFYVPGKTQLMWDSDLRPEGLAFQYSISAGIADVFINTSYFWIDERSTAGDAILLGSQAGVDYDSPVGGLVFGVGYFDYQNAKGYSSFYDATDGFGNSVDNTGKYLYDYDDVEVFAELTPAGALEKCTVFADFVSNIADGVDDSRSWLAGASYGKASDPGTFDLKYSYRYIEKDAIIGAFTDSDFLGGGSDGKGHKIDFNYQVASKTKATVTVFLNQSGIDKSKEYTRIHFDLNFKL